MNDAIWSGNEIGDEGTRVLPQYLLNIQLTSLNIAGYKILI